MRRLLVLAAALPLAAPASVAAAGGGLFPTFGGQGASAPGGPMTYVAVADQNRTVIQAVRRDGGAVERWRVVRGTFGIPGAAYDGSTTGLSADGRTLVLAESPSAYPPRRTRLLVLRAADFSVQRRVTLPGYSSVDAISPDGRWLYLVRYLRPNRDPTDYEVRAYDLRKGRLATRPVIDPSEPDEDMGGTPMSRAVSPDGRWAYTLYDAKEPFIHALDTVGRTAKCIDLPQLAGQDLVSAKVKLDGGTLTVGRLATVDTRTWEVAKPQSASPPAAIATPSPRARAAAAHGTPAWPFVVAGLAVVAILGVLVRRRPTTYYAEEKATV